MAKKTLMKYYILILTVVITGFLIFISHNVLIDVFSLILLAFVSFLLVEFDYIHPYVWFGSIYTLYSISHPILFAIGESYEAGYSKELIFIQWLGLVIFLLVVTPKKYSYQKIKESKNNIIMSRYIYIFSFFYLVLFAVGLSQGSHTSKSEMYSSASPFLLIGFKIVLIFLIVYGFELVSCIQRNDKSALKITFYTLFIVILIFFFSAERDIVLRYVTITFFIYYIFSNDKFKQKIKFLPPLLILIVPLLSKLKYLGINGEVTDTSNDSFLTSFLKSDFSSASKNIQIILEDETSKSLFKGYTIISDIIRSVKLDVFLDDYSFSAIEWFNIQYFAADRAGQGFSLVGEGYVNFGYFGVVLILLLVSVLIKSLYFFSAKKYNGFMIYILSIPIFMYAIRADLANILSPLIIHVLLSISIVIFLDHVLKKAIK